MKGPSGSTSRHFRKGARGASQLADSTSGAGRSGGYRYQTDETQEFGITRVESTSSRTGSPNVENGPTGGCFVAGTPVAIVAADHGLDSGSDDSTVLAAAGPAVTSASADGHPNHTRPWVTATVCLVVGLIGLARYRDDQQEQRDHRATAALDDLIGRGELEGIVPGRTPRWA